jgi:hypothetical protein
MHKPSIYVETSVWSYAFAEDAPESQKATLDFFAAARKEAFQLFIRPLQIITPPEVNYESL